MIGQTVVTQYNNVTYKIDDVDFSLKPSSCFTLNNSIQEDKVSFANYVEQKYKVKVTDQMQPMLVSNQCYLIPELCFAIGMTERLSEQKQIFRQVALAKNSDAPIKIREASTLVK